MSKKNKKTRKLTKADLEPENFKTKEENEAALEEYITQQPIYNYFQFFIGGNNVDKNIQKGKPGGEPPPY